MKSFKFKSKKYGHIVLKKELKIGSAQKRGFFNRSGGFKYIPAFEI